MSCCEHEEELNRLKEQVASQKRREERDEWERRYEARYRRSITVVYFIRCESFIKIGISHQPQKRIKQIRTLGSSIFPRGMDITASELVATEPAGEDSPAREKELHAKFAHLRERGEWFREAPELTDYINSLTKEQADASNAA